MFHTLLPSLHCQFSLSFYFCSFFFYPSFLFFSLLLLFSFFFFFFFNDPAPPEIYPLSLHDALPIYPRRLAGNAVGDARKRRHLDDFHRHLQRIQQPHHLLGHRPALRRHRLLQSPVHHGPGCRFLDRHRLRPRLNSHHYLTDHHHLHH